jgi:hypothetical protein
VANVRNDKNTSQRQRGFSAYDTKKRTSTGGRWSQLWRVEYARRRAVVDARIFQR